MKASGRVILWRWARSGMRSDTVQGERLESSACACMWLNERHAERSRALHAVWMGIQMVSTAITRRGKNFDQATHESASTREFPPLPLPSLDIQVISDTEALFRNTNVSYVVQQFTNFCYQPSSSQQKVTDFACHRAHAFEACLINNQSIINR